MHVHSLKRINLKAYKYLEFTTASRPALGPTYLLSNGYQGFSPWG